jgi:hypothetical protein
LIRSTSGPASRCSCARGFPNWKVPEGGPTAPRRTSWSWCRRAMTKNVRPHEVRWLGWLGTRWGSYAGLSSRGRALSGTVHRSPRRRLTEVVRTTATVMAPTTVTLTTVMGPRRPRARRESRPTIAVREPQSTS